VFKSKINHFYIIAQFITFPLPCALPPRTMAVCCR